MLVIRIRSGRFIVSNVVILLVLHTIDHDTDILERDIHTYSLICSNFLNLSSRRQRPQFNQYIYLLWPGISFESQKDVLIKIHITTDNPWTVGQIYASLRIR